MRDEHEIGAVFFGKEPGDQLFLFLFEAFQLFVQVFFFLLRAAFLPLHFISAFAQFALRLIAQPVKLVFAFENCFFFLRFGGFHRFAYDPLGFLLGRADQLFRGFFSMPNAREKGDNSNYDDDCSGDDPPNQIGFVQFSAAPP